MTTFTVRICVDNAAFEDTDLGPELGRILKGVSTKITHLDGSAGVPDFYIPLKDLNGNTVGSARIESHV